MKNVITMLVVLLVVAIMFAVPVNKLYAGYDHAERPDSATDCIDALMPIPTPTAKEFGNTDKVRLVYNIAELLKAANAQELRIVALEKQVAELMPKVDTVPEVVK